MTRMIKSFLCAAFSLALSATSAFAFDTPYLTFRSASSFSLSATKRWDGTLQKATGNPTDEASWSDWTGSSISAGLSDGQYYIYLRGKDNTTLNNSSYGALFSFSYGATSVYCEGDIEALRDYEGNPPAMAAGCCKYMFSGCTVLLSAPSLSATTLANECYFGMFKECSSLTTAPVLPAMTMATDCYRSMFEKCTGLKSLPSLPATTTALRCYMNMFSGCSGLEINTALPGVEWSIPAQVGSLASSWNSSMFQGTSGSFTGNPQAETPYYVASALPAGVIYQIGGKGTLDLALVGFSANVDLASTVKNGTAPYTFTLASGTLPPGLNVSGSTLFGTPTTTGNYSFSLSVTDAESHTLASAAYTMQVVQPTVTATTFVGADGSPITTNCITLTTAITTLNQAWYVASGTLNFGTGGIKVSGDVNLVLADSASMTVQGASNKAGINVAQGNSLTIYGQTEGTGTLSATGDGSDSDVGGAGIGGNDRENCGTITINGGTIVASAGGYAGGAGIGGGSYGNCGAITINRGTVTATGANYAAGIGGGRNGSGGAVTINGGTVTATAGSSGSGYNFAPNGIGQGYSGSSKGTLTVGPTMSVKAGSTANPTEEIGRGGSITIGTQRYFFVETAGLVQETSVFAAYANESKNWNLADTISGGTTPYIFALKSGSSLPAGLGLDGTTITGKVAVANTYTFTYEVTDSSATPLALDATYTLTVTAPDPITETQTSLSATVGKAKAFDLSETVSGGVPLYTFALASGSNAPDGFMLVNGVLSGTATSAVASYSFTVVVTDALGTTKNVTYTFTAVESTGFTDDDPEEPASGVTVNCLTPDGEFPRTCHLLTSSDTIWEDSWYVVQGSVSISGVTVSGKVSLILADGATLTIQGEYRKAGIRVVPGNTLSIYCQKGKTGTLNTCGGSGGAGIGGDNAYSTTTGEISDCGKVNIYGGVITASGNGDGAGIGGGDGYGKGGTINIYGGTVTATAGSSAAGIGGGYNGAGGDVTIDGGTVTASTSSSSYAGIGGNYSKDQGTLKVGANVVVKADTITPLTDDDIREPNGAGYIDLSTRRNYYFVEYAGPVPLAQTTRAFTVCVGDAFEVALANTVSGGTSPYTFVQKSGTLPTGLSFANGVISGAPVAAGSASVVFTVTDFGTGADAQSEDFTYTFTVTAKPKKITYYNGAVEISGLTPTNYVEGTATTLAPTAPAATGYAFAGWYDNAGLSGLPVTAISTEATGDQTFWAKFTPIEYTITYMDGATPMTGLTPTNYTIEAAATLPATATKAGYGFYGWYTNSTFTGSEVTAIPVGSTGNKTFYAKWGVQRLSTAYVNAAGVAMPNEDCIPISSGTSELEDGWYVVNGEVTADSPITVSGDVNVILADGARLSVTGSQYGAAINVAAGNSLTIYCQSGGSGRLEATATSIIAAAIGSGSNQNGGSITINGGVVVATSTGSGIGSGFGGTCGTITINGGEVAAQGGSSGAGIGSCMNGVAGTVVINGGTVTATSAGAAAIGGGSNVAGGTVTINGGTVTATGGSSTPGIGAGSGSSDHGSLTVGANVVVKAGANANPTVVINPNGETDLSSLLTGQRYFTAETVGDAPLAQRTGTIAASENTAFEISLATTISGGRPPYEFSGTGPGELGLTLASDGTLSGTLAAGTYNFSVNVSDAESADITANYTLTVAYTTKLIYYFDGGTRIVGHEPSTYVPGEVVELVPYEKEGYTFNGWYLDGEFLNGPYASISASETTSKTFFGKWTKNDDPGPQGDGVNVTFINAEGISQTTNCVVLTTETTTLADGGWYVVTNALNYNGSGITVAGTANLVIADDASLTVGGTAFYAGITLPAGTTLNVFGQSNGSGTLTATGNYGAGIGGGYADLVGAMGGAASCGTLVVNGGNVTAIGSMEAAGIGGGYHGAGGTLVVNRGTVTVTGGNNGAGIGGGNGGAGGTVTVNGGSVTATGGSMGAGIGGGSGATGGDVIVNGGTVTATGAQYCYGIGAGSGIDLDPGTLKIAPALAAKAGAAANPQTEFYADGDGYVTFGSAYQYCTVTASGATPYIDADGTEKAARCRAVSSSVNQRVVLDEEWYVVEGDVTVQRGMSVSGNVKLILVDGASLTVTQDHDSWAGISVTNGNSLTIYGQSAQSGVLTVTGGYNAAGIGGDNATACGTITINGGVITAQGGQSGAGMGGGKNGNGGTVVVNRGTLTVTGGSSGAGIGGGENGSAVAVTINGGIVTANGGEFASAIGGGLSGNGGSVTVNGGSVSAVGGDYGGTAIGKGMSGSDNGTLTVAARILVKSGTTSDNLTIVNPTVVAATLVPDGKRYSSIVPAVVCPIAYVDDDGVTQLANIEPAHYVVGVGATLPATATKTGCVFDGWYASSALSGDPVTEISASAEGAQIVYAKWIYASMVSFVDASGQPRQEYCRRLTASSERTLSTGWYYVDGEVTLDTGLAVSGDVTLILADGAKLSVQGAGRKAGITVTTGNSLTIYGQAAGTGKLFATGGQYSAGIGGNYYYDDVGNCGAVTINGGIVVAKGTNGGAGIGGGAGGDGGEVRVNGGVVVADGGVYVGYGIGAGNNRSNHGSLRVGDGVQVFAGSSGANATRQVPEGGVVTLDGKAYYEIDKSALAAEGTYLTFSSDEVFTISALKRWDGMVQYSTNATLWTVWDGTAISASLADGRYLLHFRGIGNTKLCGRNDDCAAWTITGANVACNGSIENLRDYAGITPVMAGNAYKQMFMNCTALASAPALPATTITNDCYKGLFYGCTALVNPPALPATELAANCYQEMFSGCTSLATLPVLPATNLANSCYYRMFYGCSSIKIYTSGDGIEWSIPADAVAPAGAWSTMMFYQTGGDFTSSPEIGVTYYVVAPEATEYSITYMDGAEEMTGLTPATYLTGEGATLPTAETVTKPGWLFIGWHVSSDCTDAAVLTIAANATGDKTFYADWEEVGEPEFTIVNGTLTAVNLRGNTAITIPDSVTNISSLVFNGCTYLQSVTIPSTVTNIGYSAFNGCSALASLTIPGSVEQIGNLAFFRCTSLTNLTISNGVKTIGESAFWGCSSLTNGVDGLYFPDSVESIGTDAFESCGHLTKVSLPGAMYVAGAPNHPAFNHVITEVTYRVLEPVFHVDGNNTLQSVELNGFTEITIPSTVRAIAAGALADAVSLESVTIPSSVTNIKVRAFAGCTGLTSVTMAEGPVAIGAQAFYGCTGLTRVTIPDSVMTLEDGVFWGCTSLSGVTVGSGVTQIDELTFQGCTSLSSVTFRGNVTHIGTHAFAGCSNLSNQTFPDSLEDIATDAFKECVSIKMVTIPAGVLIHSFAFRDCTDLKNVKVGKGCTIEPWAFYGCTRVKSVSIGRNKVPLLQQARLLAAAPQLLTADPDACTIGSYAFFGCGDLDEVELGSTVVNIGGGAFAGCPKLTTIDIEEGNDSYKAEGGMLLTMDGTTLVSAFGTETSIAVPSGVVTVEKGAFADYATLTNVTLSASVVTIGEAAFSNCTVLATATIQSNVTSIAANAFYGTALATVYVSKGDTAHIRGLVEGTGYSSPVTYIELGDEPVVSEDWPETPSSVEGQTAAAAFGITGELANAKADDLATWAKAKGVDYANREEIIPDAFLLNCANSAAAVATATEEAEEAIEITAITIVDGVPQLTYPATYGNGQVVIQGSANIGTSASWHDGKQSGDRFFKTVLRLK